VIPQSTLSYAAEFLVTAMGGPEMAYKIAGGSKWWQVRAGSGVEGEWIVMKKDWKEANGRNGRSGSRTPDKMSQRKDQSGTDPEEGLVGEDGGVRRNGECKSRSGKTCSWQSGRKWMRCVACCIVSLGF
jgi:hypothetical protein